MLQKYNGQGIPYDETITHKTYPKDGVFFIKMYKNSENMKIVKII